MSSNPALATRDRLLSAATDVFAMRGYELATVREITDRAGANQAAINYHFGSKAALYTAAIDIALAQAFLPFDVVASSERTQRSLLEALVGDLVAGTLRSETPPTHVRLLAIEVLRPTGALREVIRDALSSRAERLGRSLTRLRGANQSEDEALLTAHWLLGSCLVALQLAPESAYGMSDVARREQALLVERLTRLLAEGVAGRTA